MKVGMTRSGEPRYARDLDILEKDITSIDWALATDSEIKHTNILIERIDSKPIRAVGSKCKFESILDTLHDTLGKTLGERWRQIPLAKTIAGKLHKYYVDIFVNCIHDICEYNNLENEEPRRVSIFKITRAAYCIAHAAVLSDKYDLYSSHEQKQE